MAELDTDVAPEEAPSRRETIEAAFAEAEAPAAVETVTTPELVEAAEPTEAKPERTAAEKARDEAGRFAKSPKVTVKPTLGKPAKSVAPLINKTPAAAPTSAAAPASIPASGEQPKPEAQPSALKAPASWKPAARERWASLPPEVQQETHRRERETQAALQESSEARKNWGSFQQAVAPYAGMIQAEGANPVQAAAALFQTAAALRTAPAHTKAGIVANLVRTYGIDIGMLDQALAGQAPQATQGQPQEQGQFRDPRFDQFMGQIEREKQQRAQAQAQQHAQEVTEFGSNAEFFDDVREEMADLLEVSARRGVAMSLEDAYSRAVKLHPEVSKVMAQRETAKAATANQATTQRARAAASSVKSRPSGPAPTQAPQGRRAQLEAAFDANTR